MPGYEGKTVNLTSHPDGVLIGPAVTSAEFIKTSADKVIAIEKGALFTRFIEESVHSKHKSLLISCGGQAPDKPAASYGACTMNWACQSTFHRW